MESIIIYPKNEKQKSLLKSLLEEMKVRFKVENPNEAFLSDEEFYAKIDRSVRQAASGKTKKLPRDRQKEFLGL